MTGICDVCFELEGNATIKYVRECKSCNALICNPCYNDYIRRGKAAIKRKLNPRQK